jgi:dihydrofolate reductase
MADSSSTDEASARMNKIPKFVFSDMLREPLGWNNTRLLKGDLATTIRSLKQEPGDPIRSFGSITLVKGLIDLGLLDRLRLLVFPVVLGKKGREPLFEGYARAELKLLGTRTLDSRLVLRCSGVGPCDLLRFGTIVLRTRRTPYQQHRRLKCSRCPARFWVMMCVSF